MIMAWLVSTLLDDSGFMIFIAWLYGMPSASGYKLS